MLAGAVETMRMGLAVMVTLVPVVVGHGHREGAFLRLGRGGLRGGRGGRGLARRRGARASGAAADVVVVSSPASSDPHPVMKSAAGEQHREHG